MRVEVDQSGRFEYTKQDTVVAFANGKQYAILIPAGVKRACIDFMRQKGVKPPRLQVILFATTLFLLLQDHINHAITVVIDREYFGNEALIKSHLLNLLKRAGRQVEAYQIQFDLIGRESRAHNVAISTFRGKLMANKVIRLEEMLAEL